MLQDLPLFNDTIYYNILYGRLGASQEDIFQAAKQAAVHDQILAMPDGYASLLPPVVLLITLHTAHST